MKFILKLLGCQLILTMGCIITLAAQEHETLKVWPQGAPGAIENSNYKEEIIYNNNNSPRITKVTDPILDVYFPPKDKANGTAVIICPGGAYKWLATVKEGTPVAKWLNQLGIMAIVLNYRLPSDQIMEDKSIGPLQDVQESMRIIRRNAKAWGISNDKIGIMGFSAGGHLASSLSVHYDDKIYQSNDGINARPDFSILIYPVISMNETITNIGSRNNLIGENPDDDQITYHSNELHVTKDAPPAFLVHSADDTAVPVQNSINYMLALRQNEVSCELHIYEKGGHGYGIPQNNSSESSWPKACEAWLKAENLIQ